MRYIKTFNNFIFEAETSSYDPPKYLVSPPLDQEGNGTIVKRNVDKYLNGEYNDNDED